MLHRREFMKPSMNRPADRTELEESLEPEAESVEPWQQDDQLTENIVHVQPSDYVHPNSLANLTASPLGLMRENGYLLLDCYGCKINRSGYSQSIS